jgi:hypothetical protein
MVFANMSFATKKLQLVIDINKIHKKQTNHKKEHKRKKHTNRKSTQVPNHINGKEFKRNIK